MTHLAVYLWTRDHANGIATSVQIMHTEVWFDKSYCVTHASKASNSSSWERSFKCVVMIFVMVKMVQKTLVNWAGRYVFENRQDLACAKIFAQVPCAIFA